MSSDKTTQTAWRRLLPRAVLYHEAVADRLGINPTDLKCLELLAGEEAMSPSRLAELAGLTTGAITGVIDRLERAGIVRREPDPTDRRRIAIHIRPERTVELSRLYAPFLAGAADLETSSDAPSPAPTSVGVDAVTRLLENETGRLRAAAHGGMVGDTFVAPTGAATQGRLVFIAAAPRLAMHKVALGQQARLVIEAGASRLRLLGPTSGDELVRARFKGAIPDARASVGTVTVRYSKRPVDLRTRSADLRLEPGVPWQLEIEGGLTDIDGDLTSLRLISIDVRGGANHIRLRLPAAQGTVRISVSGGASDVRIERPARTAVSVLAREAISHLRFDGRARRAIAAGTRLQSNGFVAAADRYEIELSAASQVTIGAPPG